MRALERNKKLIHYASFIASKPVKDEWGNETGEYENEYSAPLPYKVNVSAARGEYATRQFGDIERYDKVLVTGDMSCPIAESSILWVDKPNTNEPHDYIVTRVARSLNSISIAIRKVTIDG